MSCVSCDQELTLCLLSAGHQDAGLDSDGSDQLEHSMSPMLDQSNPAHTSMGHLITGGRSHSHLCDL